MIRIAIVVCILSAVFAESLPEADADAWYQHYYYPSFNNGQSYGYNKPVRNYANYHMYRYGKRDAEPTPEAEAEADPEADAYYRPYYRSRNYYVSPLYHNNFMSYVGFMLSHNLRNSDYRPSYGYNQYNSYLNSYRFKSRPNNNWVSNYNNFNQNTKPFSNYRLYSNYYNRYSNYYNKY